MSNQTKIRRNIISIKKYKKETEIVQEKEKKDLLNFRKILFWKMFFIILLPNTLSVL